MAQRAGNNSRTGRRPYEDANNPACAGWEVYAEYTEEMCGAKDRRPGLDRLLLEARRARQVVVCWALDRIGRDLKHLLAVLEDLQCLNIPFVSLRRAWILAQQAGVSNSQFWQRSANSNGSD